MPSRKPITPCLLLDWSRMEANIERMATRLNDLGVPLRPHVKTCKNIEIARALVAGQPGGITVSTLAEADHFFAHGFDDILYAVGIAPGKIDAVIDRLESGMNLRVIVDHPDAARALAAAHPGRVRLRTLIEIDADGHRAGFKPDAPALEQTASILTDGGVAVDGVMVHAGGSYNCADIDCIARMADQERDAAVGAASNLRSTGLEAPIVSIGSTPTATFAEDLDGVTEVRAGVHVFQDLVQAGLGVCRINDIAVSVRTEVIGHRSDEGEILVDAGWMALSRDRGTADQAVDLGYGLVCDEQARPFDGVIVSATNQEHGIVARTDGTPLDPADFPIGRRLRILPNHACATTAQHAGYWIIDDNHAPSQWLERCGGW